MASKWVYQFNEGDKSMKDLLGGKGANLAEMTSIGLPVPPGFTITTEVCNHYSANASYPDGVDEQVAAALAALEADTGKKFGDAADPLLLCVRSGARASMPGMMDTILNLGLNDTTVQGVIADDRQPALRLRLLPPLRLHVRRRGARLQAGARGRARPLRGPILEAAKEAKGVEFDTDLDADDLKELVAEFKAAVKETHRQRLPRRPACSSSGAPSRAVFGSWGNDRAVAYRRLYDIPDDWGTAVNVQTMVYGNTGDESGTGVAFTRDPRHRRERLLRRVPGQRAGRRRGRRRAHAAPGERARARSCPTSTSSSSRSARRSSASCATCRTSSSRSRRAASSCCRRATASAPAWPRSASPSTSCEAGLITPQEALMRVEPEQLNQLLRPIFVAREPSEAPSRRAGSWPRAWPPAPAPPPASVVFNAADAEAWAARGEQVLLVRDRDQPRGHPRHGRRARASSRRAAA